MRVPCLLACLLCYAPPILAAPISERLGAAVTEDRPVSSHAVSCLSGTINGTRDARVITLDTRFNQTYAAGGADLQSFTTIDAETFTEIGTPFVACVSTNSFADGIAWHEPTGRVFVGCSGDTTTGQHVRVYTTSDGAVPAVESTITLTASGSGRLGDLILVEAIDEIWVTRRNENEIVRIDPVTAASAGPAIPFTPGDSPRRMAEAAGIGKVFVGDGSADSVHVVATGSLSKTGTISLGTGGAAVADVTFISARDRIWAFDAFAKRIVILAPITETIESTVTFALPFNLSNNGRGLDYFLAGEVWVSDGLAERISAFDAHTGQPLTVTQVCAQTTHQMVLVPDAGLAHVTIQTGIQRAQ